ncbi:effector-associated constant component EACC1 [Streptomyces boluensis]|uniref:Uncharacterized protein n=1 Tax=Streptomyces boluensis TaxID=1775135 RepID=A0A964XI71_9ACTN|nr:hypothetical protein [Streptomyces boluensis]NBE49899.1 hypothetical protein [Streptomyces boluensis]
MLITVRCPEGPTESELRSLAVWLESDRSVGRYLNAELTTDRPRVPGQQGDGIDILSLIFSSGFSAASLAAAIASWRATRPQPPMLVVERPGGTRIEIHGTSPAESEALVRRLLGDDQADSDS